MIMVDSYNNYETKPQLGGTIQNLDELKQNTVDSLINIKINDIRVDEEKLKICDGNYYQLHHFMMGKGKSAIITPLLSLHLNIFYYYMRYLKLHLGNKLLY